MRSLVSPWIEWSPCCKGFGPQEQAHRRVPEALGRQIAQRRIAQFGKAHRIGEKLDQGQLVLRRRRRIAGGLEMIGDHEQHDQIDAGLPAGGFGVAVDAAVLAAFVIEGRVPEDPHAPDPADA